MATVAELRATAKAKGLKGYSKLNKQQLEGLIIKHNLETQKKARKQQEQQKQSKAEASAPKNVQKVKPEAQPLQNTEPQAPVQEAKPEITEQPREPWQEHTCDHCNGTPNWTHEQFIRGILLSYERTKANSKVSEYLPMSRYLTQKYSLAQLHNLAKFFGLNVPAIELTSENKTGQKTYQIANIIAGKLPHA